MEHNADKRRIRAATAVCLGLICGILVAGLWPFHAPVNQVRWLRDGVAFGRYGSMLSAGRFHEKPGAAAGESLELWLQPRWTTWGARTILAFDSTEHPGEPFAASQAGASLIIRRYNTDGQGICRTAQVAVPGVLRPDRRVFVAIVLNDGSTSVYVDGVPAKVSAILGASRRNLTGKLIVANSPRVDDSWSGKLFGLAVYHRALTRAEVEQDFDDARMGKPPQSMRGGGLAARYSFAESGRNIVPGQVGSATDLLIPTRYFILHPAYLSPVWLRYRNGWPAWGYWKDVLINIGGFVPLGLFLMSYFRATRCVEYPIARIVLVGFFLSFIIESLQWFLPTRDSDMTDLVANTLGALLGAELYRWGAMRGICDCVISICSAGKGVRDMQETRA